MYKLTLLCVLVLGTLTLAACSNQKKKLKAKIIKECIDGGDKQFADPTLRKYFHDYCECSGETTSGKLSSAEWKEFEKMKKEGRDAEIQAKLMPIIQPCLDELQKKIMNSSMPVEATQ